MQGAFPQKISLCRDWLSKSNKRAGITILLLAFLLGLGTLNRGLQTDDHIHRDLLLDSQASISHQLNHFFTFFEADPHLPWWSHPEIKVRFWRPFSALSHWLDYQLWPESPHLMHLHNVVWYALLCLVVFVFYKRLLSSSPLAFTAALIFTVDFSHFANLSWIASRNSLISALFLLLSFIFYTDWRKHPSVQLFLLSASVFTLALLSGESAIVLLGLVFLHELLAERHKAQRPQLANPLALLLFAIGLGWYTAYLFLGFGSANNSMYFPPGEDNIFTLLLIIQKLPVMLFSNLSGIDGFYNVFPSELKSLISLACFLFVALLFLLFRSLLKQTSFNFLVLASLGVSIPVSMVAVLDMRLLLAGSIFSAGLLALIAENAWSNKQGLKSIVAILLLLSHVGIGASQWLYTGVRDSLATPDNFQSLHTLQNNFNNKYILLLNHPSPVDLYYFPFVLDNETSRLFVLNNNFSNYNLTRLENGFEIASASGLFFKNNDYNSLTLEQKPFLHGVYGRSAFNGIVPNDFTFEVGKTWFQQGFIVRVVETLDNGNASKIQFVVEDKSHTTILLRDSKSGRYQELDEVLGKRETIQVTNW